MIKQTDNLTVGTLKAIITAMPDDTVITAAGDNFILVRFNPPSNVSPPLLEFDCADIASGDDDTIVWYNPGGYAEE